MRSKLTVAILVFLVTANLGSMPFAHAEPVVLKVSHFLPPVHSIHRDLVRWADEVKQKSNGQLVLEIFPAGKMGPPEKQYELAQSGAVDISLSLHAYTSGKFPMTEIAQLPFVVRGSAADGSARLTELAPKYLEQEYPGTRVLLLLTTPTIKMHLAHKRIDSLESFKGLRLRVSGDKSIETAKSLGAVPVGMPPGQASEALKTGALDGVAFPYEATRSFNIGGSTKYSFEPGFNVLTIFLVINRNAYERLPTPLRKLLDETTGPRAARTFGAHLDEQEQEGKKYMVANGTEVVVLPRSVLSRIEATTSRYSTKVLGDLNKSGLPSYKFYVEMLSGNAPTRR